MKVTVKTADISNEKKERNRAILIKYLETK